jgi:diguanylate cyclase (GGDEF)-like protein
MIKSKKQTVKLFSIAQLIILLMFIVVTLFAVLRLFDVSKVLQNLARESVPNIASAASLVNQIQMLSTLTSVLASSQTNPARQVVKQKIAERIALIVQPNLDNPLKTEYFDQQLSALIVEIYELDSLVEERISQQEILIKTREGFVQTISLLLRNLDNSSDSDTLRNRLLDILLLAMQSDSQTRMHSLRQIESALVKKTNAVILGAENIEIKPKGALKELQSILVGPDGLLMQKIQLLRISGRTKGRDYFVQNLISNVSSNLEYQNQLTNQSTISAANEAMESSKNHARMTAFVGIFALFVTLTIIYFLYKRIVLRMLSLSRQVEAASELKTAEIFVSGNDEISQLASKFSDYLTRNKAQELELLSMTLTDPLTGIPNRRAFEIKIDETIALARRNNWPLTVLMVDIDFFKGYNDYYGHSEGDNCLRLVASEINQIMLRNTDFCARFGGEEFICILSNADSKGAKIKAEKLRIAILNLAIKHAKSEINDVVTASIGSATFAFSQHNNWESGRIIEQTDKALYEAKAEGRNRIHYVSASQKATGEVDIKTRLAKIVTSTQDEKQQ